MQQQQQQQAAEATVTITTTTTATDIVNLTLFHRHFIVAVSSDARQYDVSCVCVCVFECLSVCMFLLFIGSNSQLNLNFENVCTFVDRIAFSHPCGIKIFCQLVFSSSFSLPHFHSPFARRSRSPYFDSLKRDTRTFIHLSRSHSLLMCLCIINYIQKACVCALFTTTKLI